MDRSFLRAKLMSDLLDCQMALQDILEARRSRNRRAICDCDPDGTLSLSGNCFSSPSRLDQGPKPCCEIRTVSDTKECYVLVETGSSINATYARLGITPLPRELPTIHSAPISPDYLCFIGGMNGSRVELYGLRTTSGEITCRSCGPGSFARSNRATARDAMMNIIAYLDDALCNYMLTLFEASCVVTFNRKDRPCFQLKYNAPKEGVRPLLQALSENDARHAGLETRFKKVWERVVGSFHEGADRFNRMLGTVELLNLVMNTRTSQLRSEEQQSAHRLFLEVVLQDEVQIAKQLNSGDLAALDAALVEYRCKYNAAIETLLQRTRER